MTLDGLSNSVAFTTVPFSSHVAVRFGSYIGLPNINPIAL